MTHNLFSRIKNGGRSLLTSLTTDRKARAEIDALYRFLHILVHAPDNAADSASCWFRQTNYSIEPRFVTTDICAE